MSQLRRLGFVGLGKMGAPMASLLYRAGFELVVHDVHQKVVDAFSADHPRAIPASGASTFADVDALVLMLPDSDVVESVLGNDGTAAALAVRTLVVDMSSSVPERTRRLAARLGDVGLRFVDAPVSGGVSGAVAGTLTIMTGGEQSDLDQLAPVFAPLANNVIATGPVGSGHAAKALNNLVSAATISATVEALHLAERFGIPPEVFTTVLNASSGRSNTTENKVRQFMISGTFDSGFSLQLMAKDVRIAVDLADDLGARAEVAHEVNRQWSRVAVKASRETDHTRIYELIRDEACDRC